MRLDLRLAPDKLSFSKERIFLVAAPGPTSPSPLKRAFEAMAQNKIQCPLPGKTLNRPLTSGIMVISRLFTSCSYPTVATRETALCIPCFASEYPIYFRIDIRRINPLRDFLGVELPGAGS